MDAALQEIQSRRLLASATGTINALISEIWPIIGAIGAEKLYIPGVLKSALSDGTGGVGSQRKLLIGQVGTVFERVVVYEPEKGRLSYEIEENAGEDFKPLGKGMGGVVQLEEVEEGVTRMTWRSYFEEMDPAVEEASRPQAIEMFQAAIGKIAELAEK